MLWQHSSLQSLLIPFPTPHAFVDLPPRLVALKADDPTFLMTIMITGPVALCVPPFDTLGLPLHFAVCPPASVDFLFPFDPSFGISPVQLRFSSLSLPLAAPS